MSAQPLSKFDRHSGDRSLGPVAMPRNPRQSAPLPVPPPEASPVTEIWHFCLRHPMALAGGLIIGFFAAVAYTATQTPAYQATATLEIQDVNDNFLNAKELSPVAGMGGSIANDMQTQLRVLRSDTLMERALAKAPAEKVPAASPIKAMVARLRGGSSARQVETPESLLEGARNRLSVKETRQARIVDITFDSPDPVYAATLANTVANEYIQQNIEWRYKMSEHTGEWLNAQLEDLRKKLTESENNLQRYADQNGLLFMSADKESLSEDRLRQIQTGLLTAQQDRVAKQSRLETAQTLPATATFDGINDSSLRDLQGKLTDLKRQRADLATVFKPNFDSVKRLDAQIATLEAAVKTERATIMQRLRDEYDDAARREKILLRNYNEQTGKVSAETRKSIQYGMLKHEVDSNRQLYEVMLQRVKESNIAAAMRASNVRVLDPAKTPRNPYKPTPFMNLVWGMTAGLMLGAAFAMGRDHLDRSVTRPGDLTPHLAVPELGAIPTVDMNNAKSLGFQRGVIEGSIVDIEPDGQQKAVSINKTIEKRSLELVTWQQRESKLAENFRSILTSILFSNQLREAPRMIVVTSATAGEGKTTVASNLALAMARMDRRVLLIDGDLRRPRLHDVFDTSNEYGLSDLLTLNTQSHRDMLHYVTQKSPVAGVYLLASGPDIANAADLLQAPIFAEVLSRSREFFDFIIIDAPPMQDLQDARILGRLADGVVLVVRAGKDARDQAAAAAHRLTEDGTVLLGTVLNRWAN